MTGRVSWNEASHDNGGETHGKVAQGMRASGPRCEWSRGTSSTSRSGRLERLRRTKLRNDLRSRYSAGSGRRGRPPLRPLLKDVASHVPYRVLTNPRSVLERVRFAILASQQDQHRVVLGESLKERGPPRRRFRMFRSVRPPTGLVEKYLARLLGCHAASDRHRRTAMIGDRNLLTIDVHGSEMLYRYLTASIVR
jgi:hypothetical protein